MSSRRSSAVPTQVPQARRVLPSPPPQNFPEDDLAIDEAEPEEDYTILWVADAIMPAMDIYGAPISPFAAPDDFAARWRYETIQNKAEVLVPERENLDMRPMDNDETERLRILREEEAKMERDKGIFIPFRISVEKAFAPVIKDGKPIVDKFGIPIPGAGFRNIPWVTTHERLIKRQDVQGP